MSFPTATYRLQMRGPMTFARAAALVPQIAALGVSHLYLSPIFTASGSSMHGYDVTDPSQIDPSLGGREGFSALARAAQALGMGIVLDIVPNHTAFTLDNPWLRDVLRNGETSRYARHFDIDWARGRLVLPFLPEPFETMLARGAFHATPEGGGALTDGVLAVPLMPGSLPPPEDCADIEVLRELHEAQNWRLTHWEYERDGVTHRRFFNVTGLIGMRVEDPQVFEDMHALLFELIEAGEVQGIRIDHIDGLADPAAYLRQLRARVGALAGLGRKDPDQG